MRGGVPLLAALMALSACSGGDDPDAAATDVPKNLAGAKVSGQVVESEYGTPVKDRVATLGLLNKRNNKTEDVVLKAGNDEVVGHAAVLNRVTGQWPMTPVFVYGSTTRHITSQVVDPRP